MKKLLLPLLLLAFATYTYGQDPTVIDLTDVSEDVLSDTLTGESEGTPMEIILNPDVVYEINSTRVSQTTVIRSDPSGPKAQIAIYGNFWLGEVVIDSLIFEHVFIKCDWTYVFNNGNDYSVDKVAFKDCRIESTDGIFRGKASSGQVTDYIIDNCVIDSVGEYTLLRPQTDNFVTNLKIKNSTINHAFAVWRASEKIDNITLENVTFNEGKDADHWLPTMFEMANYDEFTITNVIFGPGWASGGGEADIAGIYVTDDNPVGNLTVTNSYRTSDLICTNEVAPFPTELVDYSGTAADLWADPASGDFTIVDNDFEGKFTAGDPRWIPGRLSELSISVGELSPAFDPAAIPAVLSYTTSEELPPGTEAVVVTAVPAHEGATVTGDGAVDVSDGSGTANIVVTEGDISQTYTIEFTVMVGIDEDLKGQVDLYYNSFSDEVVIKNLGTAEQLQKVEIFSLSGQVVRSYMIEGAQQQTTIGTSDLGAGMYILRGSFSNDASVYLKFMK